METLSSGQPDRGTASPETALDWSEVAAMLGDFREAVWWLDYLEWLQNGLSPELTARRQAWAERCGAATA